MDVAAQAANGYRAVQLQSHSARSIEAKLFAEITAGLVRARRAGKPGQLVHVKEPPIESTAFLFEESWTWRRQLDQNRAHRNDRQGEKT
jgi:hypothetical protein